jgi:hypothetical protein
VRDGREREGGMKRRMWEVLRDRAGSCVEVIGE